MIIARDIKDRMAALKGFALRMDDEERAIVEQVQESLEAVGVRASLNDVLRHLIRAAAIPVPADKAEAQAAWIGHLDSCERCSGHRKPQCPDGVLIRREFQRQLGRRDGRRYVLQPVVSRGVTTS